VLCDQLGRPGEALAEFDRAIEIDPRSAGAHTNRGVALRGLKRFEEALAAYDRAIEIDPRDAQTHSKRGSTLNELGRFEEALAAFDRTIAIDPRNAPAYSNRGNALLGLRRFEEALAAFDRAIEIDPLNARAHSNRGNTLCGLGRFEEALAAYDRALGINTLDALTHSNRGNALYSLGRFDEALAAYDRALEIDPRNTGVHSNRAFVLGELGRFEREANLEARLDDVLSGKARPRDADERIEFALVLYAKARHAESARMYAEAFAEDAALVEDLAQSHRYNAACSAALAAAPGGADAAEWRGRALEWLRADLAAREKAATGLADMLEHQKQDPDFASVRDRLDDLPEPERAAWRDLWAAVDLALAAARPAAR